MSISRPKVDVLIPYYNDPEGFSLTFSSILGQNWSGNIRLVIADDGSSDENYRIVRQIVEGSKFEVELVRNNVNRGRPYTRNVLLDLIDSEFVAWIDSGDEWYSKKLTEQHQSYLRWTKNISDKNVWITCNYDWQWIGKKKRKRFQSTGADQIRELLSGNHLRAYLWTIFASAETFRNVGYFDENLPRLQDLDYFIRFIYKQGCIRLADTDDALCVYHKSDIGRNASEIRNCNEYIFEKHKFTFDRYGSKFVNQRRFDMELLSARYAKNNKEMLKYFIFLLKGARHDPTTFFKKFLQRDFP